MLEETLKCYLNQPSAKRIPHRAADHEPFFSPNKQFRMRKVPPSKAENQSGSTLMQPL